MDLRIIAYCTPCDRGRGISASVALWYIASAAVVPSNSHRSPAIPPAPSVAGLCASLKLGGTLAHCHSALPVALSTDRLSWSSTTAMLCLDRSCHPLALGCAEPAAGPVLSNRAGSSNSLWMYTPSAVSSPLLPCHRAPPCIAYLRLQPHFGACARSHHCQ